MPSAASFPEMERAYSHPWAKTIPDPNQDKRSEANHLKIGPRAPPNMRRSCTNRLTNAARFGSSPSVLFGRGVCISARPVVARTSGASRFGEKSRLPESGRIPIPVLDDLQIRAYFFPQVRREHAECLSLTQQKFGDTLPRAAGALPPGSHRNRGLKPLLSDGSSAIAKELLARF